MGLCTACFDSTVDYPTLSFAYLIAAIDVDGNGTTDLVTQSNSNTGLSVLLNRGDGTFLSGKVSQAGPANRMIPVGLSGDNRRDVVSVAEGLFPVLQVNLSRGDGTFRNAVNYGLADSSGHSVAVRDRSGKGASDIIIGNFDTKSISFFLNNGDGSLGKRIDRPIAFSPSDMVIADLDGDGNPDLIISDPIANRIHVLRQLSESMLGPSEDYDQSGLLAVGDLNADTKPDLVIASSRDSTASVRLNQSGGKLGALQPYGIGGNTQQVSLADINGDGALDVLTANFTNTITALLNDGKGKFPLRSDYPTPPRRFALTAADLDGDRIADIALPNYGGTVSVWLGCR